MRDDIDFNIAFCQIIEQYPALYDYNRSDYCNRNVQSRIWRIIANKLQESGECFIIGWVDATDDCRRPTNVRRHGVVICLQCRLFVYVQRRYAAVPPVRHLTTI